MNDILAEALREGEAAFRRLMTGQFIRPTDLAVAMYWVHINPDVASGLLLHQEVQDGES